MGTIAPELIDKEIYENGILIEGAVFKEGIIYRFVNGKLHGKDAIEAPRLYEKWEHGKFISAYKL